MRPTHRTETPLAECLSDLLRERGMTARELARRSGASPSHLSRVMRGAAKKRPSGALAREVAIALDLPPDYFPEARVEVILERIRQDPELREEVYRLIEGRGG